ncbi:MAG: hypothetical protein GX762_03420 [Bacteroidales bacterium]|nr:hypothetical protein [Bacteroidales bacterium]
MFNNISPVVDAIFNSLKHFAGLSATEFIKPMTNHDLYTTSQHPTRIPASFIYQLA